MANGAKLATSDPVMNAAIKAALVMAFIAVVALFIFFGGGAMTVGLPSGDMPGSDGTRGISWIWIYIFLSLSLSILLGWFISGKK